MTNFGWWQSQVMAASQGKVFMCMVCFDTFPVEHAHTDTIGQKWDMCLECGAAEQLPRCSECRMPEPRHKMDCSEARKQLGPKTGPSESESQKSDSTENI